MISSESFVGIFFQIPSLENAFQPMVNQRNSADASHKAQINIRNRHTQTEDELQPGDIVPCEVVTFQNYDLIAVAVGAPSRRETGKAAGLPVIG